MHRATVLRGPNALIQEGYPVIVLKSGGRRGLDQALDRLPNRGGRIIALRSREMAGHTLIDPLFDVIPFYRAAERLSAILRYDSDDPPHLSKVTRTT